MLDNEMFFTATTATVSGTSETYNLDTTTFYCLKEKDLHYMADHLFDQAYKKLEKSLFFATGFGVVLGMIIMSVVN